MKKYKIDAMTPMGELILKKLNLKLFDTKSDAWDYVGFLDEKYPLGHFVVLTVEGE